MLFLITYVFTANILKNDDSTMPIKSEELKYQHLVNTILGFFDFRTTRYTEISYTMQIETLLEGQFYNDIFERDLEKMVEISLKEDYNFSSTFKVKDCLIDLIQILLNTRMILRMCQVLEKVTLSFSQKIKYLHKEINGKKDCIDSKSLTKRPMYSSFIHNNIDRIYKLIMGGFNLKKYLYVLRLDEVSLRGYKNKLKNYEKNGYLVPDNSCDQVNTSENSNKRIKISKVINPCFIVFKNFEFSIGFTYKEEDTLKYVRLNENEVGNNNFVDIDIKGESEKNEVEKQEKSTQNHENTNQKEDESKMHLYTVEDESNPSCSNSKTRKLKNPEYNKIDDLIYFFRLGCKYEDEFMDNNEFYGLTGDLNDMIEKSNKKRGVKKNIFD